MIWRGIAACLLVFLCLSSTTAATICVQNNQTGRYEARGGAGAKTQQDCAAEALPAKAAPVPAAAPVAAVAAPSPAVVPLNRPAPVANAPITPPPTAVSDPAQLPRTYRLKFSDVTVRLALKRWLKDANMQLAYEAPRDFEVPVEGDFQGTASEAVQKLMTSLKKSSYPLRACEYDNRVILVLHRNEECPLEDE